MFQFCKPRYLYSCNFIQQSTSIPVNEEPREPAVGEKRGRESSTEPSNANDHTNVRYRAPVSLLSFLVYLNVVALSDMPKHVIFHVTSPVYCGIPNKQDNGSYPSPSAQYSAPSQSFMPPGDVSEDCLYIGELPWVSRLMPNQKERRFSPHTVPFSSVVYRRRFTASSRRGRRQC